jgi:hypothetical protein
MRVVPTAGVVAAPRPVLGAQWTVSSRGGV